MDSKISSWFKKEIRSFGKRSAPSPFLRKIGKVFNVLVLLVVCSFIIWRLMLSRQVAKKLGQLRASGLPTSGAELNAWRRPVPDAENGALTQAFALRACSGTAPLIITWSCPRALFFQLLRRSLYS